MDLIEKLREQLRDKLSARAAAQTDLDAVLATPSSEARDLNDDEAAKFATHRDAVKAIDEEIAGLTARVADLTAQKEAREAAETLSTDLAKAAPVVTRSQAVVTREERTYSQLEEQRGRSFLADLVAGTIDGDPDAQARLSRHRHEERTDGRLEGRAAGTGAFAGLTVPQYLTDMVAPAVAGMRPTANICTSHPLPPDGMTLNISRVTTATSAAVQATENSAVSETNIDDTLLTVNVRTIAGQQTLSRQAIERGTGTDALVVDDLVRRYHTTLDNSILNDDGTAGTHLGIRSTGSVQTSTYTDASPTAAEAYPKLFDIIQKIQAGVYAGATHFIMAPRRFWWIASQVGTSFPFLQFFGNAPQTGGSVDSLGYGTGASGNIGGVPVIVDGNMKTDLGAGTEDVILGVTDSELHLWEDPSAPLLIRAEQTPAASLGVLFVVYGYSAFTAGRYPGAHGIVSGTGLIAPTF